LPKEYPASASAGTVDGPLALVLELVVEFGRLAEAVFEVDGAAFCEDLSSIMGESLYSLELLLKLLKARHLGIFKENFYKHRIRTVFMMY